MGPIRALRDFFHVLNQTKQEAIDALTLREVLRKKRVTEAADLDHGYIQKIMEAMPAGTEVRIILRSGEAVEIYKPGGMSPEVREGPGW
jgi:hypothetical protein